MKFRVGGRTAATAATAGHAAACFWNPSSAVEAWLNEFHITNTTGNAINLVIRRATARGTAGSTVTPDIDNEYARAAAPPSGVVLDLATYSVQPTLDSSELDRWVIPGVVGAGKIFNFGEKGLLVPPGAGIAIATSIAAAFDVADLTAVWKER